jgi:hypothetical protein
MLSLNRGQLSELLFISVPKSAPNQHSLRVLLGVKFAKTGHFVAFISCVSRRLNYNVGKLEISQLSSELLKLVKFF